MNKFRPLELMEGYTEEEMFKHVSSLNTLLSDIYGNDREAKIVCLCFILGRTLVGSKVTTSMAIGMVGSAHAIGSSK